MHIWPGFSGPCPRPNLFDILFAAIWKLPAIFTGTNADEMVPEVDGRNEGAVEGRGAVGGRAAADPLGSEDEAAPDGPADPADGSLRCPGKDPGKNLASGAPPSRRGVVGRPCSSTPAVERKSASVRGLRPRVLVHLSRGP